MIFLILFTFILVSIVAFYGDYEEKEKIKDYEKYKEITNEKRRREKK